MKYTPIGKVCLVVGALIGIVPLLVFLSLPIYIIGCIIILKSKMVKREKVMWVVMPLIAILAVWFIIWMVSVLGLENL